MKSIAARLAGGDEPGLPETGRHGRPEVCSPTFRKKTATPAATRHGSCETPHEAIANPHSRRRRKALRLTSVGLVACYSDEGHFFGWEVAR
jgi:hypothetical protein